MINYCKTIIRSFLILPGCLVPSICAAQSVGAVLPAPSAVEFRDPVLDKEYNRYSQNLDQISSEFFVKANEAASVVGASKAIPDAAIDERCRTVLDDLISTKAMLDERALTLQSLLVSSSHKMTTLEQANSVSVILSIKAMIHSTDMRLSKVLAQTYDSGG